MRNETGLGWLNIGEADKYYDQGKPQRLYENIQYTESLNEYSYVVLIKSWSNSKLH